MQFDSRRIPTLMLMLLLSVFLWGCFKRVGNADPEVEKARRLIEEGHYEAALMRLNRALAEAPKDPGVHLNLGWLYLYTNDPDHAAAELARAEALSPETPEAWHLRGALLSYRAQHREDPHGREDLEQAVINFKKALAADARNDRIYFDLATALNALNRSNEALLVLDRGFNHIPRDDLETQVNFQIASCVAHMNLKQFNDAIADCNQAAEFTENPASRQRIADLVERMRLLNPRTSGQISGKDAPPTPEQEKEARKKNMVRDIVDPD